LAHRGGLCVLVSCALASCSQEVVPTGDPQPQASVRFLTIELVPSEANLGWESEPDGRSVALEPELSWEAQFLSPGDRLRVYVVVELLDGTGTACFESDVAVGDIVLGRAYRAGGGEFRLPRDVPVGTPPQNPCGVEFVVDTVRVQVRERSSRGPAFYTRRVPCLLHFSMRAQP